MSTISISAPSLQISPSPENISVMVTSPATGIIGKKRKKLSSDERLTRSRERNRIHAKKTRERKKCQISHVQDHINDIYKEGIKLRTMVDERYTASSLLGLKNIPKERIKKSRRIPNADDGDSTAVPHSNGDPSTKIPSPNPLSGRNTPETSISNSSSNNTSNDSNGKKLLPSTSICGNYYETIISENSWLKDTNGIPFSQSLMVTTPNKRVRRKGKYTPEEREEIRKERNRIHAKKTRDRKKTFLDLSNKIIHEIEKENSCLRNYLKGLQLISDEEYEKSKMIELKYHKDHALVDGVDMHDADEDDEMMDTGSERGEGEEGEEEIGMQERIEKINEEDDEGEDAELQGVDFMMMNHVKPAQHHHPQQKYPLTITNVNNKNISDNAGNENNNAEVKSNPSSDENEKTSHSSHGDGKSHSSLSQQESNGSKSSSSLMNTTTSNTSNNNATLTNASSNTFTTTEGSSPGHGSNSKSSKSSSSNASSDSFRNMNKMMISSSNSDKNSNSSDNGQNNSSSNHDNNDSPSSGEENDARRHQHQHHQTEDNKQKMRMINEWNKNDGEAEIARMNKASSSKTNSNIPMIEEGYHHGKKTKMIMVEPVPTVKVSSSSITTTAPAPANNESSNQ